MSRQGSQRTFYKDLQQLYKTIASSTDGQAEIVGADELAVIVALKPKTGYNAHAVFTMTIQCQVGYPRTSPDVTFHSPIFHPNIDAKLGHVCLSILSEWLSCWSLLDVVKAMLYLLEHPNYDSPNNEIANVDDISEIEVKTKRLLAGLKVNGRIFPANEAWCEWARENHCLPTEEDKEKAKESESQIASTSISTGNGECNGRVDRNAHNLLLRTEEIDVDEGEGYSFASSETAPSYAKIRHSVESDEQSHGMYSQMYMTLESASQRVVIWNPANKEGMHRKTIYYFLETLCDTHHNGELGNLNNYLYSGNKLREDQSNPDSCQTSSSYCWYPVDSLDYDYSEEFEEYEESLSLQHLFKVNEPQVKCCLTEDFCPWAVEDGLGNMDIFGKLFFDKERGGSDLECFLFNDDDSCQGSDQFGLLFHFDQSEGNEDCDDEDDVDSDINAIIPDTFDMETESEDTELYDAESEEDGNNTENNDRHDVQSISSKSTRSYCMEYKYDKAMHECSYCNEHEFGGAEIINQFLEPQLMWLLRRTRWSIRFAPQQSVNISMEGIKIPPWRVSTARLLSDICQYCRVNKEAENVVLLDPMALSPLSPVLNLMRHKKGPIPRLEGILWMTTVDAISPFYRVPIPAVENEEPNYPSALSLRALTLGAFAANWVGWLSRIETSSSLGITRFAPIFIGRSIAACVLQPLSLGCGQSSLLGLWPLWLLRSVLKSSLFLSKLNFQSDPWKYDLNFFFPFSDLDEI